MISKLTRSIAWDKLYAVIGMGLLSSAVVLSFLVPWGRLTDTEPFFSWESTITISQAIFVINYGLAGLWCIMKAFTVADHFEGLVVSEKEFNKFKNSVTHWANTTFPEGTDHTRLRHLLEEVEELALEPGDAMEMADIFIILVQHACLHNIDLWADLAKMEALGLSPNSSDLIPRLHAYVSKLWTDPNNGYLMTRIAYLVKTQAQLEGVDLWKAIQTKYIEIQARTWHPPDENGVVRHIKVLN